MIVKALRDYAEDTRNLRFPNDNNHYNVNPEELEKLREILKLVALEQAELRPKNFLLKTFISLFFNS